MKTYILTFIFLSVGLLSYPAQAALSPQVSEALTGQTVKDFETETLDGQKFSFSSLLGKPVVINFFASWCPACEFEISKLKQLQPNLTQQGVVLLGVLVDPIESPETVGDAMQSLHGNPLPYPIIKMNQSMKDIFTYEGFPSTYFISPDGKFSTTLLGVQPLEQIQKAVEQINTGVSVRKENEVLSTSPQHISIHHHDWEKRPLLAFLPENWEDWHPIIVHFPIALLFLEAVFLCAYWFRPNENFAKFSAYLLVLAVLSLIPVIYSGIHDAGNDLGPGSPFWNGLKDRLANFFRFESTISLHVIFALAVSFLTLIRLLWRAYAHDRVLKGKEGFVYMGIMFVGLWLLFAAGQVGGGISHP